MNCTLMASYIFADEINITWHVRDGRSGNRIDLSNVMSIVQIKLGDAVAVCVGRSEDDGETQ